MPHMLPGAVFGALVVLAGSQAQAAVERAYIGTYTAESSQRQPRNHGEGIYLVDVDTATG